MTRFKFDSQFETIIIDVVLEGKIIIHARLVLDTGASFIVLPWRIATALDLKINPQDLIQMTTVSSVESSPITQIPKVTVLNKSLRHVPCLIKDLPAEAGVDGLLGLSFLSNFKLELDFKKRIFELK